MLSSDMTTLDLDPRGEDFGARPRLATTSRGSAGVNFDALDLASEISLVFRTMSQLPSSRLCLRRIALRRCVSL
jgi:hypothetical protein